MVTPEKLCVRCGAPRPKGRPRYCSDECFAISVVERTRLRDNQRMQACKRCQGPKEPGVQGSKYCAECRRIVADTFTYEEYERGRRRNIKRVQTDLAAGKRIRSRTADAPDGHKWCARCQEFRPLTSFPERKDTKSKRGSYCIPCQRAYNRERRVRLFYGLDWDDYERLLVCQDYRCAICGGRPRRNALAVDHDHKTGELRGLLCSRCNHKLLGTANDDPARLRKAANYLEAFFPREVFGESRYVPGYNSDMPPDSSPPSKDAAQ